MKVNCIAQNMCLELASKLALIQDCLLPSTFKWKCTSRFLTGLTFETQFRWIRLIKISVFLIGMPSTFVFVHAAWLARSCSATMQSYSPESSNKRTQQLTNTNPRSAARVFCSTHPMQTDALTCATLPNDKHSPQHGSNRNKRTCLSQSGYGLYM